MTLVAVLAMLDLAGVDGYVINKPGQSLHGAIGSAFGLYLNVYEAHNGYLPANWDVLWSLSIEEVFSISSSAVGRTRIGSLGEKKTFIILA